MRQQVSEKLGKPARQTAPDRRASVVSVVVVLAMSAAFFVSPLRARLDGIAFDSVAKLIRHNGPLPAIEEVVIVGIDEATEQSIGEPFGMWHEQLAAALKGIARGAPKLVAMDIVLPDRSFDAIKPGLDAALIRAFRAVKDAVGQHDRFVVGQRIDARGGLRRIDDMLLAAIGTEATGLAYAEQDLDGTVRRFRPAARETEDQLFLAARIADAVDVPVRAGLIDFACGRPLQYIALREVLTWQRTDRDDLARKAFQGKIVLLGSVMPDEDSVRQPLSLAAWDPEAIAPPGVVAHAQIVRALQSGRMLQELSTVSLAGLTAVAAMMVSMAGLVRLWVICAVAVAGVLVMVHQAYLAGIFIAPSAPIAAALFGATLRTAREAFEQRRERLAIERRFAGYVSRSVLEALLAGEIDGNRPRKYEMLGFLFADIRGFTTMSEKLPPEQVIALLNRYYEAITPAIHAFDGTIDNFRGDGILAIFGAPRPAPDAPRRAALAACHIFLRLRVLNEALVKEGRDPVRIGIGLAAGDAIAGHVGAADRHGYTAVGDAVNVAARLQSLCKPMKMKLIATEAIAAVCADDLRLMPLGQVDLAGHSPVLGFGLPTEDKDE
ncbi:MAG TPA: CHASE2 domain-containing protein [Burkholderiales bacterium]|nr:CHASE2 domain-containing protein [Burkholderiales bacterium]